MNLIRRIKTILQHLPQEVLSETVRYYAAAAALKSLSTGTTTTAGMDGDVSPDAATSSNKADNAGGGSQAA